jgi:hypothetical protein
MADKSKLVGALNAAKGISSKVSQKKTKGALSTLSMDPKDLFNPTELAEMEYNRFIKAVPESLREDTEYEAMANSFSADVFNQYKSDLERWQVALQTAKDWLDQNHQVSIDQGNKLYPKP